MIRSAILTLGLLALSSCDVPREIGTRSEKVEIVKVKPPKHFELSLKILRTNEISTSYVAKRCGSWNRAKTGQVFEMPFTIYENKKKERTIYGSSEFLRRRYCD